VKAVTPVVASRPQDGDVAVTRELRSAVRYGVRQLPGDVQFVASSRDEGIRIARTFAQKYAVNVWYFEGEADRLIAVYRPSTPGQIHSPYQGKANCGRSDA
jgi:hypothetical protein